MGKNGLFAATCVSLKLMGLNCSESTISKAEDLLASFPKEKQDVLAEEMMDRICKDDLTEQEALKIVEEFEEAM